MGRKKMHKNVRRKPDHQYQHISNVLAEKSKKKEREEIVHEMYVDCQRGISVQLGGADSDLKTAMDLSGISTQVPNENQAGQPNDVMYLRQADHFMKRGSYKAALVYLKNSITLKPESKIAHLALANCHLLMGNWSLALKSAEMVLSFDKSFIKAIYAKAESLYNCCDFEHALIFYYRGQRLYSEMEEFRLGIQKCRKAIYDGIKQESAFKGERLDELFKMFKKSPETILSHQSYSFKDSFGSCIDSETNCQLKTKLRHGLNSKKVANPSTKLNPGNECNMQVKDRQITRRRGTGPEAEIKMKLVRSRCIEKSKTLLSDDRLLIDKIFLANLAKGIAGSPGTDVDMVKKDISETAEEALVFLKGREEFWNQLELADDGDLKKFKRIQIKSQLYDVIV